jgi:hypothetical protein
MSSAPMSKRPFTSAPVIKRPFSIGRVSICLLPLLALALWIVALSSLATAGDTATASSPAHISVPVPAQAKTAQIVMLELSVSVVRKPSAGHLGAVVKFKSPEGPAVEVGRFSIADRDQSYQFNVSRALARSSGGTAEVEVTLIDRGGGEPPAGAALSVGRAEIVAR